MLLAPGASSIGIRGAALKEYFPGLAVTGMIALSACFIADHYGGPLMLYALLFGMSLNFLAADERCIKGIDLACTHLLRTAIALLGMRVSFEGLGQWTVPSLAVVASGVVLMIGCGLLGAKLLKLPRGYGVLSGGAVAICGASAALAIAAVTPEHRRNSRMLPLVVAAVTILATAAMALYPLLAQWFGLDATATGFFLGASIHDVAQVAAAGLMHSPEAADVAVFVKMLRVAMLVPLIALLAFYFRAPNSKVPKFPLFLIVFVLLAVANGLHWIPQWAIQQSTVISQSLLAVAVGAIGLRTNLGALRQLGWKPVALLAVETLLLAALAFGVAAAI